MWLLEALLLIFLIIFGAFELASNSYYLSHGGRGLRLAKRQHREIPANAPDEHWRWKVQSMLLLGLACLATGLFAIFARSLSVRFIAMGTVFVAAYGIGQALAYPGYRAARIAGLLHIVPFVVFLVWAIRR